MGGTLTDSVTVRKVGEVGALKDSAAVLPALPEKDKDLADPAKIQRPERRKSITLRDMIGVNFIGEDKCGSHNIKVIITHGLFK